jgi:hypothetical protein
MKLVRERLDEKFKEESDPIHDMGIGIMHQIKTAMKGIVDLYGTGDMPEEIADDEEVGYTLEIKFSKRAAVLYYIVYNYETGFKAGYEDLYNPYDYFEDCDTLEEAVEMVDGWITYMQENN